MKLTLIRGLPGSGKSTYAKNNYRCLVLENDMFQITNGQYHWSSDGTKHAINAVYTIADLTLSTGSDVVIANTFTKKRFIDRYKQLAEKYNAEFEVIRMINTFDNIHNVPKDTLKNMRDHFDDWPGEVIKC